MAFAMVLLSKLMDLVAAAGRSRRRRDVSTSETDPLNPDTDGDYLQDGCPDGFSTRLCEDQNNNGVLDDGETDPRLLDTDGGGISDDLKF